MKNFALAMLLSSFISINAQEKNNIIKTNITGYAFRNINVSYERAVKKWLSINVGFGIVPSGNVPFLKSFIGSEGDDFQNVNVGLSNFTIEPRFYLGEGYGKGFYIAPYYRYSSFNADNFVYNYKYKDGIGNTELIPLDISGKASGNSVGVLLGVQFFLGKNDNWILDLWIIGGHYGSGKGEFNGKSRKPLTQDQQNQLAADLEDIQIPIFDYKVGANANGAQIKLDGPWAGIRSGLSFGYRF